MNEYLKPVFQVLLPKLQKAKIDYWVYGGISIASYAGEFIRDNKDVDIFVRNINFEQAKSILNDTCNQYDYKLNLSVQIDRPKIEVNIDGTERFSMIPVYQKDDAVVFIYREGNQEYPNEILEKVKRNISGYIFFTSQNKFIKDMFIEHIKARPDKKSRTDIIKDAETILNHDERLRLGFKK